MNFKTTPDTIVSEFVARNFAMKITPLDNLLLGYPCPIDWESMTGDERKRYCNQCSLNVYNISDMSEEEANLFLADNEDTCVRFYARKDGTIKTESCAKYFQVVRHKLLLLKAAVSFFVLLVLAACTGSSNSSQSIRRNWDDVRAQAKHRFYDPDEFVGMAGRPMYTDLRLAMQEIVPDSKELFYNKSKEEEEIIQAFRESLLKTRTIQETELKKVRNFYKKTDNSLGLFNVDAIEMLLKFQTPISEDEKKRLGSKFEANRQRVMDRLIAKAEEAIKEKNQFAAEVSLEECIRVGSKPSKETVVPGILPEDVEAWQFQGYSFDRLKTFVTTRDNVHRLIRLWEKVAPSHPNLAERKLSLELALLIKDDPENKLLKKEADVVYRDMLLAYHIKNISQIKVAKIIEVGDKIETSELNSTKSTKKVKFRTVENIKGNKVGPDFLFDYVLNDTADNAEDHSRTVEQKEDLVLPKIGDVKLVLLYFPSGKGKYSAYHYFNGVLAESPDRVEKVKAIVASQKLYTDGAYKLSAKRSEFWDKEHTRQWKPFTDQMEQLERSQWSPWSDWSKWRL